MFRPDCVRAGRRLTQCQSCRCLGMFTIAFAPRYRDTSLGQALPAGQRDVAIIRVIAISRTAFNPPETTLARGTAAFPMRAFAIAAFLGRRIAPGREAAHSANQYCFFSQRRCLMDRRVERGNGRHEYVHRSQELTPASSFPVGAVRIFITITTPLERSTSISMTTLVWK